MSSPGDEALARRYAEAITVGSLVLRFGAKAAGIYVLLRGDPSLRAPDAIQLACAASARADLFVTNDARLRSKQVEGIQFIVSLE